MDYDLHDADACEICGADREIGKYLVDGETAVRCRKHQGDGISLDAENMYWQLRLPQLQIIESNLD